MTRRQRSAPAFPWSRFLFALGAEHVLSDEVAVFDVAVVGLGPNGVRAAGCLASKGLSVVGFDAGTMGNTMRLGWPPTTRTQSTIDDVPASLILPGAQLMDDYCNASSEILNYEEANGAGNCCSRSQYLRYLEDSAASLGVLLHEHEPVLSVRRGERGGFVLESRRDEAARSTLARFVVMAIGSHSSPRTLGVPGADLPHVVIPGEMEEDIRSYSGRHVAVVGCGNSAIEIVVSLCRAQRRPRRILLVCRHDDFLGLAEELPELSSGRASQLRKLSVKELTNLTFEKFGQESLGPWPRQRYGISEKRWDMEQKWYEVYAKWAFRELHRCGLAGTLVTCSQCEVRSVQRGLLRLEAFPLEDDAEEEESEPVGWSSWALSRLFPQTAGSSSASSQANASASTNWTVSAETVVQAIGSETVEGQLLADLAMSDVSAQTGETAEPGLFTIGFDPQRAPQHHSGGTVYQNWLAWGMTAAKNTCDEIEQRFRTERQEL